MVTSVPVEFSHTLKTGSVIFPSSDISFKLAKEIVSRAAGNEHPPGNLYVQKENGTLVLPDPEIPISTYDLLSGEKSKLVYKPTTDVVTVIFSKQFIIDRNMSAKDIQTALTKKFQNTEENTSLYISTEEFDTIKLTDLHKEDLSNEESAFKKLKPLTTIENETNHQGIGSNILFVKDTSISPLIKTTTTRVKMDNQQRFLQNK